MAGKLRGGGGVGLVVRGGEEGEEGLAGSVAYANRSFN